MIRIGVLGFAHGHCAAILKEWQAHPEYGVTPAGGWDHDPDRAQASCREYGMPCFDSPEALLSSDISAVLITSETGYHADMVRRAAGAGKDIILYKPMALTMKEADSIVEAVEQSGVRFTMGWQMRTDPQNRRMRDMIRNGELGKTCLFRRRHSLPTHIWAGFEDTWHNDPAMNRDIFADDSSHPINLMQWIFGMPETVTCEMSTMVNPRVPNDNAVALFRYADGLIAEISCSFTCSASEITTEVYCEKGSIQQYFGDNPGARLPRVAGMPGLKWYKEGDADWTDSDIPSPASHGPRIGWQAAPLADFLKGGEPICSVREGRDTLRLVLACYLSAREGRRVSVNDPAIYDI